MTNGKESNFIAEAAATWAQAGCSVIMIRADGTKRPVRKWKPAMRQAASVEEVAEMFRRAPRAGIGVVCGKISGKLEMLELEGRATSSEHLDRIFKACESHVGAAETLMQLMYGGYAEWTPGGGLHFLYRLSDHDVPGNTPVARRPATAEELAEDPDNPIKVLSETRGEGGFVVVAPSGGAVHKTGNAWTVTSGQIGFIPTLTWAQRENLHRAIYDALDEMPKEQPLPPPPPRPTLGLFADNDTKRPGDLFNEQATWHEILVPHGWEVHHEAGGETFWTRPGKAKLRGLSASTGYANDMDRLYVFSSSTVFTPEKPYSKFSAFALLEHNGDHSAAARALAARMGSGVGAGRHVAGAFSTSTLEAVEMESAASNTADLGSVQQATPLKPAGWRYDWQPPARTREAILSPEASYASAATAYAIAYEDAFKYCGQLKKWFFFNGQVWNEDHSGRHEMAGQHFLAQVMQDAKARQDEDWIKWTRNMTRSPSPHSLARWARIDPRIAIEQSRLDSKRHMVTLGNGVYDLDTATFTSGHDPKLLATKQIPINYDKDAQAPQWDAFLEKLLPDAGTREYLQRAAGMTLLGDGGDRVLFLLHGDPGTGKSQVVRVFEQLFGDWSATAVHTAFNESSRRASVSNDLNDLRGKRFVTVAELNEDERLNEALLKRLTGGDRARSRGLYQENSEWRVEFNLFMVTNFLPKLSGDDAALWKRVKPIKFPTVIENNGGEIKNYGDKLFAEEASGILNWLLAGVTAYKERGLKDLPQITEAVAAYRRETDNVAQFVDESADERSLVLEETQEIGVRQLHACYQKWCERNGQRWLGERRFNRRIEALGGYVKKRAASGYRWTGIGIGTFGMLGTMEPPSRGWAASARE